MVLEFGHIKYLQLRHLASNYLQGLECFIARADKVNRAKSADSPRWQCNDHLKSYALFKMQNIVSRVVGFFFKRVDQGATKLNDCKGLGMERPSNSARLLHQL